MGKPLFGSALVSVFSGWYELLGLISTALSGPVLFFREKCALICRTAGGNRAEPVPPKTRTRILFDTQFIRT